MNIKKMARKIENHYQCHGALIRITNYETVKDEKRLIFTVRLLEGTRENLLFDRAKDIKMALQLPLFQPFYEDLQIRIAVSKYPVMGNSLLKMLECPDFRRSRMRVCLPLGYDMRGEKRFYDLASDSAPHTLDGGGSGSGKSVFLRCSIIALTLKYPVSRVNLIIIDCGGNSLDLFHSLPHLSHPIVKDVETSFCVLKSLVDEMERRLSLPIEELKLLPVLAVIWDEYNSTIKNIADNEERKALINVIEDLLRRCRKTKIHIILATQECNKKDMMINMNNLNARIAFCCSDFYNSRSIIGMSGAENLPGKGAMLFKSPEQLKPAYIQGAFISLEDLERQIERITSANHDLSNRFTICVESYLQSSELIFKDLSTSPMVSNNKRELAIIIIWVLGRTRVSKEQIKKMVGMGNRVDGIMDELLKLGIVSDKFANQPRKVLPQSIEDISDQAMAILSANGVSIEEVQTAIDSRSEN